MDFDRKSLRNGDFMSGGSNYALPILNSEMLTQHFDDRAIGKLWVRLLRAPKIHSLHGLGTKMLAQVSKLGRSVRAKGTY